MDGLGGLTPPSGPQFISPPPYFLKRGLTIPRSQTSSTTYSCHRGNRQALLPRITPTPPLAPVAASSFRLLREEARGWRVQHCRALIKGQPCPRPLGPLRSDQQASRQDSQLLLGPKPSPGSTSTRPTLLGKLVA